MPLRILYAASERWGTVLTEVERLATDGQISVVKDEPRIRAGFLSLSNSQPLFVKSFTPASWLNGVAERLRGSRAARSLRGHDLLRQAGFAAPEPLAAAELTSAGAVRASYLLSAALDRADTFSRFVDRRLGGVRRDIRWRAGVLRAVASEVRRLHDARLYTSDLQETNLMLEERGGQLRVYFVDLDRFRLVRSVSAAQRERNLVQLDRSIGRFLTRPERLRFLYAYMRERPGRHQVRQLIRSLLAETQRKDAEYSRRRALRSSDPGPEPDAAGPAEVEKGPERSRG